MRRANRALIDQFESALMLPELQPSSDGFPEGFLDQRF
jgi:hypothetical protein